MPRAGPSDPVLSWLLDGDPSIRFQTLRDLTGLSGRKLAIEQANITKTGWGAQLLALQGNAGIWTGLYTPKWTSATYTLLLLRFLGLAPGNRAAGRGALVLMDEGLNDDDGINFWRPGNRNSETCVTSMVLSIASRFAADDPRIDRLAANLLAEQMPDGGWNCQRSRGATHSSLHTTISALEALLEYELAGGSLATRTRDARGRAHEFLFIHRMFRSHRTGEVIKSAMTRFAFPPQWHYDVLRGLDYLQAANAPRDPRLIDAIELVEKRRTSEGFWPLNELYRGDYHFPLEQKGKPSRWNTLRALRVLRWWASAAPASSRV